MNHMSLKQHCQTLKAAIPVRQRSPESNPQLPIFKRIKVIGKISNEPINSGIFKNLSFCIPMLDHFNDPPKQKITELVRGIFMQGGKIVEYNERMSEQFAKYVIISEKTNLAEIRQKLKGLVVYGMLLKYSFVSDSLKRLKKMKDIDYLIFNNTENLGKDIRTSELAKMKLQSEQLSEIYIRPKLPQKTQKTQEEDQKVEKNQEQEVMKPKPHAEKSIQKANQVLDYNQFCQKGISQIEEDNYDQSQEQVQQAKTSDPNHRTNKNQQKLLQTPIKSSKNARLQAQEDKNQVEQSKVEPKSQQKQVKAGEHKYKHSQKYKRSNKLPEKKLQQQKKNTKKQQINEPYVPWQPKGDKKLIWHAPPKNLASHNFQRNNFICDKLMELQQIYKRNKDIRCFSYVRAVACLKSHNKQIKTVDDLKEVQGLSHSMVQKLRQLLETKQLSKLNRFHKREDINVCKQLQKVWGIGAKKAMQFYDMGIKTVEELRKRPDLISKNMSVGLKYFQQFSKRIPREKVTRIFQTFKKVFYSIVLSDRMHHLQVVGSYRRGKATCGDIDVLICRHDGSVQAKLLMNLVKQLQEQGFITQSLSQPRAFDGRNNSAYMGVCLFEGQHHRIDIKHYPVEQYAFALMYFTGSDLFNRQMRMAAHNKGLMLSDHGLRTKERNGFKKIWKGGEIPLMRTEQEIFKFLQLDYCTPQQRQI